MSCAEDVQIEHALKGLPRLRRVENGRVDVVRVQEVELPLDTTAEARS
jgi:hypothetical protein